LLVVDLLFYASASPEHRNRSDIISASSSLTHTHTHTHTRTHTRVDNWNVLVWMMLENRQCFHIHWHENWPDIS